MNAATTVQSFDALSHTLLTTVKDAAAKLRKLPEQNVALQPAPSKWSKKEILGHLIDSAGNNHQRFVRAQLQAEIRLPGYEQEGWARVQAYRDADWTLLVDLWQRYNEHLAFIIARIEPAKAQTKCWIGEGEPVTLQWLVEDYIVHMFHHLRQLER